MDLSLPIPIVLADVTLTVVFVPRLSYTSTRYKFYFNKNFQSQDLLDKILAETNVKDENLVFSITKKKILQRINVKDIMNYADQEIFAFEIVSDMEEFENSSEKKTFRPSYKEN